MKILFESLEHQLDAQQWAEVQSALAAGAVRKATETSKNHWSFIIKYSGDLVESQVSFSQSTIQSVKCGCTARSSKPCIHSLICAAWYAQKMSHFKGLKKINTRHQINEIYNDDSDKLKKYLAFCLKQQSKLNDWIISLHVLSKVGNEHYIEYSPHLLSFIELLQSQTKNKISLQKNLHLLISEVYDTSLEHFTKHNIRESAFGLMAGIEALHFSFAFDQFKHSSKISHLHSKLMLALTEIIRTIKAPELIDVITNRMLEIISHEFYSIWHKEQNLFVTLFGLSAKNKSTLLAKLIRLYKSSKHLEQKTACLAIIFMIDNSNGIISCIDHINHTGENSDEIYPVITWLNGLFANTSYDHISKIFKHLLKIKFSSQPKILIASSYLEQMIIHDDIKNLNRLSKKLYHEYKDLKFAKLYFESFSKPVDIKEIENFFPHGSEIINNFEFMHLLAIAGKYEDLLAHLNHVTQPLDLFQFSPYFKFIDKEKLINLMASSCNNYLQEHLGPKSHELINRIKQNLNSVLSASEIKKWQQKLKYNTNHAPLTQ